MKGADIKAFRDANNLTQKELADYLGIDKGFISAIEHDKSKLPKAKLSILLNNPHNWNTTMLRDKPLSGLDNFIRERELSSSQLRSAVEKAMGVTENSLVEYLQNKVADQELVIRELYQQIGMLNAKLELTRKGEIAGTADGSSSADAV